MSQKIQLIEKKEIESALSDTTRQYLVGKLSRPQTLEYMEDGQIEIGITSYDDFTYEPPHYHTQAYEYGYMINGMTEYLDVETGTEYRFKKGDFFKFFPGLQYAQRSKPGTTLLFIQMPPGNDKQKLEITDVLDTWMKSKIQTFRSDFTNDPDAPKANSIKPAAAVAILNEQDEILLLKRRDNGKWTMPGGTLELGEDLKTCATREVLEETGFDVEITDIIGTYSNPRTVIAYSDGEVRQELTILYMGKIIDGNIRIDNESTDYQWVKLEKATDLPMAESQKQRIQDVLEYQQNGRRALR